MPLTKEERHALATRVRLGESCDDHPNAVFGLVQTEMPGVWWGIINPKGGYRSFDETSQDEQILWVLGHILWRGGGSFAAGIWEDGSVGIPPGRMGCPASALEYLERE